MKSCPKVILALLLLCAIHACWAKPKWLWVNDAFLDDLESAANDAEDRRFENVERKMSTRKMSCPGGCIKSTCYDGKCRK